MADKDMTEKTLEAFNDVFADIINGLLFEGEQIVKEDALTDAQPFSMYKADGKLHEQERDVAKYWNKTSPCHISVRIAFLGFENQTKYEKDMAIRVIGYDGAAYRAELSQEDRYPVITLVLYFGDEPWGKNRTLYDAIEVPEKFRPYVNDYKVNVFEIAHLPEEAIDYFQSDFRIVVDYFVHKRTDPDYRPVDPVAFKHVDEVLKMLTAITHDERFIESLEGEGGKPKDMCEVLDRVEARGKIEGRQEGILETLESLVKKGLLSLSDAAKEANLTPAEFQKKTASLANRK